MTATRKPRPDFDAGHLPITEEMDSARRTLPPLLPIVAAFLLVGGLLAAYLLASRSGPLYTGKIVKADLLPIHVQSEAPMSLGGISEVTSDVENRDNIVLLTKVLVTNTSEKILYVKGISAVVETDEGEKEDDAAPGGDYPRIFQAYPVLAPDQSKPIAREIKLAPHEVVEGTEVFSFQMAPADFDKRKSMAVKVDFYDRDPLTIPVPPEALQLMNQSTQRVVRPQQPAIRVLTR